jgi:hypothetical protein
MSAKVWASVSPTPRRWPLLLARGRQRAVRGPAPVPGGPSRWAREPDLPGWARLRGQERARGPVRVLREAEVRAPVRVLREPQGRATPARERGLQAAPARERVQEQDREPEQETARPAKLLAGPEDPDHQRGQERPFPRWRGPGAVLPALRVLTSVFGCATSSTGPPPGARLNQVVRSWPSLTSLSAKPQRCTVPPVYLTARQAVHLSATGP